MSRRILKLTSGYMLSCMLNPTQKFWIVVELNVKVGMNGVVRIEEIMTSCFQPGLRIMEKSTTNLWMPFMKWWLLASWWWSIDGSGRLTAVVASAPRTAEP